MVAGLVSNQKAYTARYMESKAKLTNILVGRWGSGTVKTLIIGFLSCESGKVNEMSTFSGQVGKIWYRLADCRGLKNSEGSKREDGGLRDFGVVG